MGVLRKRSTYNKLNLLIDASGFQRSNVGKPAENGYDWFDLRQKTQPYCPVKRYVPYLNLPSVQKAIGADPGITFSGCSLDIAHMFTVNGDVIIFILH